MVTYLLCYFLGSHGYKPIDSSYSNTKAKTACQEHSINKDSLASRFSLFTRSPICSVLIERSDFLSLGAFPGDHVSNDHRPVALILSFSTIFHLYILNKQRNLLFLIYIPYCLCSHYAISVWLSPMCSSRTISHFTSPQVDILFSL